MRRHLAVLTHPLVLNAFAPSVRRDARRVFLGSTSSQVELSATLPAGGMLAVAPKFDLVACLLASPATAQAPFHLEEATMRSRGYSPSLF